MNIGWRRISLGAAGVIMACLLGVTSGSGQTAPAAPGVQMAEQAFKSITVLKGVSVDEFMDTMGFFSASLGWNCTDCHGDDAVEDWANFAKDTERKTMARKMILMVKFINQTQFGGMRRVTCYTCHRGDAQPKITPSLADQYGTPPPEDPDELEIPDRPATAGTPSADQILDKYIQALGGTQRLAALKSIVAKGTYSGYDTDNQKVPVDIYAKAPAQTTMIVHGNLGDSVRVFDGRAGWIASPDRPVPLLPLTGGDVTGAKIDAMLVFPSAIKQLFPQWRVAQASIDDKDVWMVEGVATGQLPLKLFFDGSTGLLVRAVRLTDTVIGFNPTQLDFSDYRDVAGVKIPFHRVTTWTDNQTTIDLERVQPNATIDAAKFAQPPPAPPPKIRQ
jgi:photosynthetic reaction center cytochrome c subunit